MTLISAPAGFGKTTYAQQIVAIFPGRVAWFSVDLEDDDPRRFFAYFLASLREAVPELSQTMLTALDSSASPSIRSVLTTLLNELAEIDDPICGVLDDLHLISSETILQELEFFLLHVASCFHLFIATRADPPLGLARLRANGDINEIRSADLRFTPDEIASFFTERSETELELRHVKLVENRTEGWIAGLQMAALSIDRYDDPEAFLRSFGGTHRHVLDYLTAEVLSGQPEAIQRFLIRSSILSRLGGALCDALVPEPELPGQETLEYLERANLFVTALDDRRHWFRLHPLFAELLRDRLEGDVTGLHRRAAGWLSSNGLFSDALPHAAKSGDPSLVRVSIEGGGRPLYAQGSAPAVLATLERLPEATRDGDAMLWVHQAWATWTAYRSDEVPPLLKRAQAAGKDNRRVHAHIHAIRANLAANHYQVDAMMGHATQALELLGDKESYTRAGAYRALAVAHDLSDDRPRAIHAYEQAIDLCRLTGLTHLQIVAETGRGMVLERDLALAAAEASYREVLLLAGDPNQPVTCAAHAGLGRIGYARNDLEEAERRLSHGRELAQSIQGIDAHIAADLYLCRVYAASGDRPRAGRELARLKGEILRGGYHGQLSALRSLQLRMALASGELQKAEATLKAIDSTEERETAVVQFDRIRLRIAQGEIEAAFEGVDAIEERGEARGWRDQVVTAQVLRSIATLSAGDRDAARALLKDVWAVLEAEHAVRPILDEGADAAGLLAEIVGEASEAWERRKGDSFVSIGGERLSRRERDVLRLVAEGLSNEEIAERLFITVSTVKGHNSRIFEKLDVRRRTEAVAEAQRRGIL